MAAKKKSNTKKAWYTVVEVELIDYVPETFDLPVLKSCIMGALFRAGYTKKCEEVTVTEVETGIMERKV